MSGFFAELGLSVAFTMISLAPMVPEWLHGNPKPQTKVNVLVGLPPLDADEQNKKDEIYKKLSYGGCAPEVSLFNANGDRVGYSKNKKCKQVISQNSPTDIWADYIKPGETEKAEYITVSASGPDAICISAIAVTYPTSSDTYAFLPGEVAAICNTHNPDYKYSWSPSATSIQFKSESGQTQDGRPKCLWIDKPDEDGESATHYEGFQVHLPDFKLDNSTFHGWQDDPSHMCDSLARFGPYDRLDPMLCPEIFSPAPPKGADLPLDTVSACTPAAKDSATDPNICEDDRFTYQQRYDLIRMYDQMCLNGDWWYYKCEERPSCPPGPSKRRSLLRSRSSSSYWPFPHTPKSKYRRTSPDHPLQRQFDGVLVKSQDVTQSAVEVCQSAGSVGPDFYSEPEQMFCDMKTRELYPACNGTVQMTCFDPVQNETRTKTGNAEVDKRGEQRTYLEVKEWP
ncbi:hypothetical protein J4E91_008008 [Alternaria rosae]|nr:hypothetical protein J4E91_008008 [Alternaria rosae]